MLLENFMHCGTREKENGDITYVLCIMFMSVSSLYNIEAVLVALLSVADMEVLREDE